MAFTRIVAQGRGAFPIDMLRFLQAWPADSEAAARIQNSIGREAIGERGTVGAITLETAYPPGEHSLARFCSFGWVAEAVDLHPRDLQQDSQAQLTLPPVVDGELFVSRKGLQELAARSDLVLMPRAVAAAAESFLSGFEDDTGSDDNKGVPETLAGLRTAMGLQRVPRGWDKVEGGNEA